MWWNSKYPFRKKLEINASQAVPAGHPVDVRVEHLLREYNKVRPDYLDLEVVVHDLRTEEMLVLEREVIFGDEALTVHFDLYEDYSSYAVLAVTNDPEANAEIESTTPDVEYYIYYGNSGLIDSPRRYILYPDEDVYPSDTIFPTYNYVQGVYDYVTYPLRTTYSEGRISYTRPGEDWVDGVSSTNGARAAFRFSGASVGLFCETGPQWGSFEVRVGPYAEWGVVDLGALLPDDEALVYTQDFEEFAVEEIQVRVQTGLYPVNIRAIGYRLHVTARTLSEEFDSSLAWSTFTGGV